MLELTRLDDLMMSKGAGISELGMRKYEEVSNASNGKLQKVQIKPGKVLKQIYALELRLPCNPLRVDDERFNSNNPYITPVSPETAVLYFKTKLDKDAEAKAAFLDRMNLTSWDTSNQEEITEEDWKIFRKYRKLILYSLPVQMLNLPQYRPYGKKVLCRAKFDKNGDLIDTTTVWDLHRLEVELTKGEVADLRALYSPTGKKANKPKTELDDKVSAAWKAIGVSSWYYLSTIRFLAIPVVSDEEKGISNAVETPEDFKTKGLKDFEVYGGGDPRELTRLYGKMYGKYDTKFNYVELDVDYPACTESDEQSRKLDSYATRDFDEKVDTRATESFAEFDVKYREFRDDVKYFNEQLMATSVRDYREISDSVLINAYRDRLDERKHLLTPAILKEFGDVLKQVDEGLFNTAFEAAMAGELADNGGSKVLVAATDLEINEEQDGKGVTIVEEGKKQIDEKDSKSLADLLAAQ